MHKGELPPAYLGGRVFLLPILTHPNEKHGCDFIFGVSFFPAFLGMDVKSMFLEGKAPPVQIVMCMVVFPCTPGPQRAFVHRKGFVFPVCTRKGACEWWGCFYPRRTFLYGPKPPFRLQADQPPRGRGSRWVSGFGPHFRPPFWGSLSPDNAPPSGSTMTIPKGPVVLPRELHEGSAPQPVAYGPLIRILIAHCASKGPSGLFFFEAYFWIATVTEASSKQLRRCDWKNHTMQGCTSRAFLKAKGTPLPPGGGVQPSQQMGASQQLLPQLRDPPDLPLARRFYQWSIVPASSLFDRRLEPPRGR